MTRDAVIVSTARSPIGRAVKGSLRDVRPDDLVARMIEAALAGVPVLDPHEVEDVMVGCGSPAAMQGFNIARVAAVQLGYDGVPGTTVNRYCASSIQTTRMAAHAIRAGEGDVFVSAGVESISGYSIGDADEFPGAPNPKFDAARERSARAVDGGSTWSDPREDGELPDIYISMGDTAENVAQHFGVSRADMDAYAMRSQQRAAAAESRGFWRDEIVPVVLADGTTVERDDSPRPGTTLEKLAELAPVFRRDGSVTAGNSCPLNDGAAALVVMSAERAAQLGLDPLARIVSTGISALSPEIMGLGPVEASRRALARAGLRIGDIDQVELNEAFAAQVIASARELGIDEERLNVNGGAIALGHPFGSTGARITATLIHSLVERDEEFGLATMCVAGGQGAAMVLQRLT